MKWCCRFWLVVMACFRAWAVPFEQWDFNGNLSSSAGGSDLSAQAALPAAVSGLSFSTVAINAQPAQVANFTRGTFFRLTHRLGANGGGNYLNQYTVILDVMFPTRPTGWAALWQTSPGNGNDADWFINSSGGLGISGVYGGNIANSTWNRIALVVDGNAGSFTSYLNGVQVQQITGVSTDGRWSLESTALLFADEDQENAGGSINSIQLRATAMEPADIRALGGPQASGIPIPDSPSNLRILSPNGGESFQAGTTQAITWAVSDPSGMVRLDLLLGDLVFRELGQAAMRESNFNWVIDPKQGDTNVYLVRITSTDSPTLQDASDAAFSIAGSGCLPNLIFGQPLKHNGGFEDSFASWEVISGDPETLAAPAGKGAPYAGAYSFYGGRSPTGDALIRQDIDLLAAGFSAMELDTGAAVAADAWLHNAFGPGIFDDQIYFRVGFLDGNQQELGGVRSMIPGANVWVKRELSGALPTGTRKLRLEIAASHRRDADNDGSADEVTVRILRAWPLVTPQITKLPLLQDMRPDVMTLSWETDGNLGTHSVEWGRTSVNEHQCLQVETVQIDRNHFVHRATLSGLTAETSYVYRVRSGASNSPTYAFRTAPRRDTPFAVAWWGDSQVGPTVLQQMIPSMIAHRVDWMGVAGDLVTSGASLSDWQNYWFKALEFQNIGQTKPALFARGNHDSEHPYCYAYSTLPGNGAWYAFDYGNSRFIFLDSEASTDVSPEQYRWLTNELSRAETQQAAFRIVCFHKLPYANLWNGGGYTGEAWVRQDWVPLMQKYHVDMVINGHAHNYNRGLTNGVAYIVTGGGGGALDTERVANWPLFTVEYSSYHYGLMEIADRVLNWSVYDTADRLLDGFKLISRTPQLSFQGRGVGDSLSLVLSGKPGTAYILQTSFTLTNWADWTTNTPPATGAPSVTNSILPNLTQKFFRARIQP